jgi:hypothetical protein
LSRDDPLWKWGVVGLAILSVAGTLGTVSAITKEGLKMNGQHWIMLLVAVAAGYVAGRLFVAPARLVGLP